MYTGQFIITALCLTLCVASPDTRNEEIARELIEQMLRIQNPDKILNLGLDRLEKIQQQERQSYEEDCDNPTELLPEYTETVQGPRERDLRQLGSQKHYPICHLERKIRKLNTNEYEYRPAYYEEVRCTTASNEKIGVTNEICSSLGFSCIQWNKTIHLTRRRYTSDCWETKTMVIPAGCECMWPVHRLGEMKLHV